MRVESDQLDGKPSRKQGQRLPPQRQGLRHERPAVRVFGCQGTVSPPRGLRQG